MGLNPIYCLRMILSENRCPLFGIMRWRELSPDTEGLATLLFHYPFAGGGLAQLALPVQQIEAGANDDGGPRHGPAVRHMVEHQIAEDHHPDELGICLLYTSDAADDLLCVDLGGRRIIKKKK